MAQTIALKTKAYKRGRQLVDETLRQVRVDGGEWREPKNGATLDSTFSWLMENGFERGEIVMPKTTMGTVTVTRFFYKETD